MFEKERILQEDINRVAIEVTNILSSRFKNRLSSNEEILTTSLGVINSGLTLLYAFAMASREVEASADMALQEQLNNIKKKINYVLGYDNTNLNQAPPPSSRWS
jgi:hypothetical protein